MNSKISIINILIPFLYIILVYESIHIWIITGGFGGWFSLVFLCDNIMSTTDVCNLELKNSYDETGLLEYLIYFVFTARLTIAIFWFFVLKYLRRKIREKFGV